MPTTRWPIAIVSALFAAPLLVLAGVAEPADAAAPIVYRAVAGDDDDLELTVDGDDLVIVNSGASALPASLPASCRPQTAAVGVAARCRATGNTDLVLDMRDGDDVVIAWDLPSRFRIAAKLGSGTDLMLGGEGSDVLDGESGDDVIEGGYGNDRIVGGGGFNLLIGNPGNDLIDASAGGVDDFNSLIGSEGDDQIIGGDGLDFLFGDDESDGDPSNNAGRDVMDGRGGADLIMGDAGADVLRGGAGDDEIVGDDYVDPDTGDVFVTGPAGPDVVDGGPGDDVLTGQGGNDLLAGGAGADTIDARDGAVDAVTCGAGTDTAQVDRRPADLTDRSCERVASISSVSRTLDRAAVAGSWTPIAPVSAEAASRALLLLRLATDTPELADNGAGATGQLEIVRHALGG